MDEDLATRLFGPDPDWSTPRNDPAYEEGDRWKYWNLMFQAASEARERESE